MKPAFLAAFLVLFLMFNCSYCDEDTVAKTEIYGILESLLSKMASVYDDGYVKPDRVRCGIWRYCIKPQKPSQPEKTTNIDDALKAINMHRYFSGNYISLGMFIFSLLITFLFEYQAKMCVNN